jgi:hypothetical protein
MRERAGTATRPGNERTVGGVDHTLVITVTRRDGTGVL